MISVVTLRHDDGSVRYTAIPSEHAVAVRDGGPTVLDIVQIATLVVRAGEHEWTCRDDARGVDAIEGHLDSLALRMLFRVRITS